MTAVVTHHFLSFITSLYLERWLESVISRSEPKLGDHFRTFPELLSGFGNFRNLIADFPKDPKTSNQTYFSIIAFSTAARKVFRSSGFLKEIKIQPSFSGAINVNGIECPSTYAENFAKMSRPMFVLPFLIKYLAACRSNSTFAGSANLSTTAFNLKWKRVQRQSSASFAYSLRSQIYYHSPCITNNNTPRYLSPIAEKSISIGGDGKLLL